MSDQDFETIYAITFEAPERIGVMIASTPTGRRGMFYKTCVELDFNQEGILTPVNTKELGYVYDTRKYDRATSEGWKEFHLPSRANPEWSNKMERELKKQFSEVAYEHEVEAEFGTETVGVFNKKFVDEAASKGYPFVESRQINAPIAIGIDFDKFGSSSNIVVLQYDPFDERRPRPDLGLEDPGFGRFKVINHIEIPKSDMHYDLTVKTVIELDKKYEPFAIYPDKGAGEYQIEMLRKKLGDKVKGVFYGSTISVQDPISGVMEKKPLKPFLIGQTTLMLERGQLRIPNESVSETIKRQMLNYRVVRVSKTTKVPIYTDEDEHGLDAMVFALYAFMNEYPELVNTIDKKELAKKAIITKTMKIDPLNQMIKNRLNHEDDSPVKGLTSSEQQVSLGFAKRNKNRETLGWGRRGTTSRRPVQRRTF